MGENSSFKELYLREIGVVTPLLPVVIENENIQINEGAPVAPSAVSEPVVTVAGLQTLQNIRQQAEGCSACQLAEQRNSVVFGVGNPDADIVFIGEAPGRDEDLKGEPFVGRAGQLLDRMLASVGLDRQQVYIMNTVKCRPPNNRDPRPEEVEACSQWFDAQLKAISPKVICLLGRIAAQRVLRSESPLSALRERWHDYHGIPVWVMYHPAYLLRSPQQKRLAWRDLCVLAEKRDQLLAD